MSKKTTTSQFAVMLHFLQKNPHMMSGKVDSDFTKEIKNQKWDELACLLNANEGGPQKSTLVWKKTYRDWKCYVKKKAARIALYQAECIDSPLKEGLTPLEEALIALLKSEDINSIHIPQPYGGPVIVSSCSLDGKPDEDTEENELEDSQCLQSPDYEKVLQKRVKSSLEHRKQIAAAAEKQVAYLEIQTLLSEKRAKAAEKMVTLEQRKLRLKRREYLTNLRMSKLKYL